MVLRVAESAGVGLLIAAAAMLILAPLRMYQGESAVMLVGVALPLGAIMGAIPAIAHRPSVMVALVEADRQLKLNDLLSTTWVAAPDDHSAFASAIRSMAESRTSGVCPSDVLLNRFGQRGWGIIGLSGALAVILAMISANPLTHQAVASNSMAANTAIIRPSPETRIGLLMPDVRNGGRTASPDHPGAKDSTLDPAQQTEQGTSRGGARDPNQTLANPDGTGGGAGQSKSNPTAADLAAAGAKSHASHPDGDVAGGGQPGGGSGQSGRSGMSAGPSSGAAPAPPWRSETWPAARRQAESAIDAGAVPPEYHDLLREYYR